MGASITHAETENYKLVKQWDFDSPIGIAVDSSGNVYVADVDNSRIQKFDSNGKFITKWGSEGTGNGQFNYPQGIAIDSSGNVYVADVDNNRIQKFDKNGKFITKWGSKGTSNGQFDVPENVAVDSSGNVYVADTDNYRIQKFSSNGKFITKWGSEGTGNGQFVGQTGIAVDSKSNVYVIDYNIDSYTERIEKFDSNGKFITKFDISSMYSWYPASIALDSSGNIYTTGSSEIYKFNSNGKLITEWSLPSIIGGQTMFQSYIAVDSSGNVYDAYTYDNSILKYTKTSVKPIAAFSASPTSGKAPLSVKFTDNSKNNPTSWSWNFGDKSTSTTQSPSHKYTKKGTYSVSLTVKNTAGSNSITKSSYITVK
jgi:FOG: PKD repeat